MLTALHIVAAARGHRGASVLCEVRLGSVLTNWEVSRPWSGPLCRGPCGALARGSCGEACGADEA